MDRTIKMLDNVDIGINKALERGIKENDILEIATMIKSIKAIKDRIKHGGLDTEYSVDWLIRSIKDEFSDCKKYWHIYELTGNPTFQTLSKDELRHAQTLLEISEKEQFTETQLAELKRLHETYGELSKIVK